MKPIVTAMAALGTSAPVVLGCYRLGAVGHIGGTGMWPQRPPLPPAALVGAGDRAGPSMGSMQFFMQSADLRSLILLANESRGGGARW